MEVKAPKNVKKPQYPVAIKTAATIAATAAALATSACQNQQTQAGTPNVPIESQIYGGIK